MKKLSISKRGVAILISLLMLVGGVTTACLYKSNMVYAKVDENNHGQHKVKYVVNMIDNTSDKSVSKAFFDENLKFKIEIFKGFQAGDNLKYFDRYDEYLTEKDFYTEKTGRMEYTTRKEFNYYKDSNLRINTGIFLDLTENNQDYYVGFINENIRTYSDNKAYHILDTPVYKLNRDIVKTKVDYEGELKEETKKEIINKVKEANPNINNLREIKIEKDKLIIETWNRYYTGIPYITFNVEDLITKVKNNGSQTDNKETTDKGSQTDNKETADKDTQTDSKETKENSTQTKADVKVKYLFEDGKTFKEFIKEFDIGYVLDASELEMLPDNMKFIDDFIFHKVTGKDDGITRKVSYIKADKDSQIEDKDKKDSSTQTEISRTKEASTQTELTLKDLKKMEKDTKRFEKEIDRLNKDLKDKEDISKSKERAIERLKDRIEKLEDRLEREKENKEISKYDKETKKVFESLENKLNQLQTNLDNLSKNRSSTTSATIGSSNIGDTNSLLPSYSALGQGGENLAKKPINTTTSTSSNTGSSKSSDLGNIKKSTSENSNSRLETKEKEKEVRYPNKLTPKEIKNSGVATSSTSNGVGSSNSNNASIKPNKGIASSPSKARASVTENVDNANNDYPIHHNDGTDDINLDMYSADARQFITFKTKSGKEFHLIINHDEEQENVMLLTEVSEDDLLNMVEKKEEPKQEITKEEPKKEDIKPSKKEDTSNVGTYLIMFLVAAGALGAGYYFKVVKKKENAELEALEDSEDDDFFSETEQSDYEESEVSEDDED